MTEIKSWKDRIDYTEPPTIMRMSKAKDDEIAELRAALAKSQPVEQGEPYAYANAFGDLFKNRDEIEGVATELFTHPVRTMSDEPRYTVDQIADAACHAEVNDSKFESMCVYLGGIKGATE